jgi:lysyl-tRNA synthetase class 2
MKAPFARYTVRESLHEIAGLSDSETGSLDGLHAAAGQRNIDFDPDQNYGKMLMYLFDELVEAHLIQPTFITQFPLSVSPLSRKNDTDPQWVDRFELFIAGNELANAFSELNDPVDQSARFEDQMVQREAGDEEAHPIDRDYIRALEYGMPPAAGEGIGIDRLVMLMTNQQSIREVIFFPHMRPEQS